MPRKVVRVGLWCLAAVSLTGFLACSSAASQGIPMSWDVAFGGGMSVTATWYDSVKQVQFWTDGNPSITMQGPGSATFTEPFRRVKWNGLNKDGNKYPDDSVNYESIITDEVTLYPMSDSLDPSHNRHALAFTTDGRAHASAYKDEYHDASWFVLVDSGDSLFLLATGEYRMPNGERYHWGGAKVCAVGYGFDDLQTCPDSMAFWDDQEELRLNRTYALHISPRFAKVAVTAIEGKAVTFKTALQPIWFLRWVKTN